ncbi:hypothetical protein J0670_31420, partial [Streptomyces sp. FH025]|nr:hypothetical protein [Streptomyces sp. FH025]
MMHRRQRLRSVLPALGLAATLSTALTLTGCTSAARPTTARPTTARPTIAHPSTAPTPSAQPSTDHPVNSPTSTWHISAITVLKAEEVIQRFKRRWPADYSVQHLPDVPDYEPPHIGYDALTDLPDGLSLAISVQADSDGYPRTELFETRGPATESAAATLLECLDLALDGKATEE